MELARHSSLDLTLGIYFHAGDEEKDDAVTKMWGMDFGYRMVTGEARNHTESGEFMYSNSRESRDRRGLTKRP